MEKVDDKAVEEICMYLRLLDFMKLNDINLKANQELQDNLNDLNASYNTMMEIYTPEQQAYILERYKEEKDQNIDEK